MSHSLHYLIQHGPMLLAGSSLLLAVGTVAVFVQRSPVHRQRTGELTAMAVLVWLVLANVPLPRLALEEWTQTEAINRTQQSGVAQPPTDGLTETNQTRDNTEIFVAALDEVGDAASQYQQDSIIPEPNITLQPMAVEQVPSEQITAGPPTMAPGEPAVVMTPPTVSEPIHYEKWLVTIFLAGAGVCVSWLLLGRVLLSRVLRMSGKPDGWLLELYLTLPCRRRPDLLISQRASRAFSFGLVRPVIVLPQECCNAGKIEQLRAVLLHELAHTEQGDAWGRLLFNAASPLLYFHPLYWVLRRRTFMAAELIADDRDAAQTSRASYTQELIALVRAGGRTRLGHLGAMPVYESQTRFSRRMKMLMRRESCLPYRCTASRRAVYAVLFVMAVAASGGLLGIAPIQAQTEDAVDVTAADEEETEQSKSVTEAAETRVNPGTAATSRPKTKKVSPEETDEATKNEQPNPLQQAIQRGTAFLQKDQRPDGTWLARSNYHRVGMTALCTWALLKSGAKVTDAPIQKAISALRKADPKMTYGIALQTLVFCAAEPKKDLALIQRNVDLLEASQLTGGPQQGGWTYRRPENLADAAGDNSNSGFAIWALDEAVHAGAKVNPQTWDRALSQWRKGQRKDGSWGYMNNGTEGTGSMTCTGIASLVICLNHKPFEVVTKKDIDALGSGLLWLTENFEFDRNPGSKAWTFYYLMKLRHVGEQAGIRRFGDHDWYSEVNEFLLRTQHPRDGRWRDVGYDSSVDTALALLALQSGPPPRLAADAGRTWGVEGRVVDKLNEPVVNSTVVVHWALGGQRHRSVARTDQQGRFVFVHHPTYVKVKWSASFFDSARISQAKVINRKPLVLQVPNCRMGIQGIWKVVSWEQAGRKEKPEEFKNWQLHIDLDAVSVWNGDQKVSEESYRINPAVKPRQIDLTVKDKKTPGIFRLQGNKLTLCLDRVGRGRPSKFASEVDSPNEYLIELERYDSVKEIKRIEGIDAPVNARVTAALRDPSMLEFYHNAALIDGIEFVDDLHDIDVDLDLASLKKAGIDLAAIGSIDVRGVKLHVALEMWLRPLKLGYVLRDGRLVVTSRQDAVARNSGLPSAPGAATALPKNGKPAATAGKDKSLDLVQLATTYVDAIGVMELEKLILKAIDKAAESNATEKSKLETARLRVEIAERKVAMLKTIIEQEIEDTSENRKAAEVQLKFEQRRVKKGYANQTPSASRIRQLDGRLRTLQLILKP